MARKKRKTTSSKSRSKRTSVKPISKAVAKPAGNTDVKKNHISLPVQLILVAILLFIYGLWGYYYTSKAIPEERQIIFDITGWALLGIAAAIVVWISQKYFDK